MDQVVAETLPPFPRRLSQTLVEADETKTRTGARAPARTRTPDSVLGFELYIRRGRGGKGGSGLNFPVREIGDRLERERANLVRNTMK